ncbi:hypothetical protein [Campylobacter magnus]|nr:hypothetical protein [Campylobacter magnus]MDO2407196.1 hypothetical protein [Campylobacter magnus]
MQSKKAQRRLAVERRSGSVRRSSATAFQGLSRRKASRSFCVSRWAVEL